METGGAAGRCRSCGAKRQSSSTCAVHTGRSSRCPRRSCPPSARPPASRLHRACVLWLMRWWPGGLQHSQLRIRCVPHCSCKGKRKCKYLTSHIRVGFDDSGEPGPQAKGVNHLKTPLRRLHVAHRVSSCASEVVTCNCARNPGGHAQSDPRPSEEGVSFYLVLRPLDQKASSQRCEGRAACAAPFPAAWERGATAEAGGGALRPRPSSQRQGGARVQVKPGARGTRRLL